MGSILVIIILLFSGFFILNNPGPEFKSVLAESTWKKSTDKDLSNGTLINLTVVGNGENGELRFDLSKVNSWTKKSPQNCPSERVGHSMAPFYGTKKILLFGGMNGSWSNEDYSNETWIYDLNLKNWIKMTPKNNPGPRAYHEMASVYGENKVVLFGGMNGSWSNAKYSNETWIYDLNLNNWINMIPIDNPGPRALHTMASIYGENKILLYGGYKGFGNYYNNTWIYDVSNNNWYKILTPNKPGAVYYHAMASIQGTDKVLLYGGFTSVTSTDETWIYDVSARTWSQKVPSTTPNARYNHKMASISGTDKVILYGGTKWGMSYLDESWVYDFSNNAWTQKSPKNKPKITYGHSMSTIHGTDKIMLFGGNELYPCNETWEFKYFLPEMSGTYFSKPFDTGAKSQFFKLEWNYYEPKNTSITLQLRSALNLSELNNKSYVGPDGNQNSSYNTSLKSIWSGHRGDQYIQFMVKFDIFDNTVNSPSLKDVTISYNCLPNTIVLDPVNGSLLTINKPKFVWTFDDYDSDFQKAFQLIIDDDLNFETIDFNSGIRNTEEQYWEFPLGTSYPELPDGTWYWKVRTKDSDDVWTDYSPPWKLIIDTNAPSSSISSPNNNDFYNNLNSISGEATDPPNSSGLNKVEIIIKCINTNTYWDGFNWIPMKTWLLTLGTDNWVYNSSSIKWTSGKVYYIQTKATDNATNIESPGGGNSFTFDTSAPISIIEKPMENCWLNSLNEISGISLDFGGSGVDSVDISIKCTMNYDRIDEGANENEYWDGNAWSSKPIWLPTTGTNQWSFNTSTITWSTGDQYTIQSRAIDNTGNIEEFKESIMFFYDILSPKPNSIQINNDDEYTYTPIINISLQANDIGSGISDMSFSLDGSDWSSWEKFNTTRIYHLPIGDGNKTVYFKVRDYTGNIAEPISNSIILDSTPPNGLQIIINKNDRFTNSTDVKINVQGFDSLSGITNMTFCCERDNWDIWDNWEPYQNTKFISLPPGDGVKEVFFKARDKAGNVAEPVFDSIILDTTPPHSLSLLINNGSAETNTTQVSLKIKALEDSSGVSEISFSSDDGETWSAWENYSEVKHYTLSTGDGIKTIYFKVKDKAGNVADPVATSILLNTSSQQYGDQPGKKSTTDFDLWQVAILIIIIVLIIITASLIMIYLRNKRTEQKLIIAGILPIKTGDKISAIMKMSRLPGAVKTSEEQLPITSISGFPMLEKSTQDTQEIQQSIPKPPSQVPQHPRLPPAQDIDTESSTAIETETVDAHETTTNVKQSITQIGEPPIDMHAQPPGPGGVTGSVVTIPEEIQPEKKSTDEDKN